ncbi:MAG: ABC transporter ATP-binding protein [Lutispora sp.]|nr:ABC transporter ATP-binding protein [Lutispora sp.]
MDNYDVECALEICDVCKHFGGIIATDHINIMARSNTIFGIIGPNGAGKTTLFNLITGIYKPTSGDILLYGKSLVGKLPYEIACEGVARTFQNIRLFNDLTVYENLHIAYQKSITYTIFDGILKTKKCKEQEAKCAEISEQMLKSVGLWELKDQLARNLPYGLQRKLEIARALITNPKVMLLDEPAAGMNEEESEQLSGIIKDIRNNNDITIIVIDHHMDVIMDVCDEITVINFGKQLVTGSPYDIQNNSEVIDAYLGVGD